MQIVHLTDKMRIEAFLRRDPELHVYNLGDLDEFFWPHTTWYGCEKAGELRDIVLVYAGAGPATVVGLSRSPATMRKVLREIIPLLPGRFYAHLSPGVEKVFKKTHRLDSQGPHHKMTLREYSRLEKTDCSGAVRLATEDRDDLVRLYDESYPGNWFDPRMLETRQYFGLRIEGQLVSVAGVHVYSEPYRVAAVGNIVTHPAHRNKGYARLVTARLCRSLAEKVDLIGLNVKTDNAPALACYSRLGFEIVAPYAEFTIEKM
jgi:RimJ/RimL family protein N-acetyltransferase